MITKYTLDEVVWDNLGINSPALIVPALSLVGKGRFGYLDKLYPWE
jgi:hypothetical protein